MGQGRLVIDVIDNGGQWTHRVADVEVSRGGHKNTA